MDNKFNIGDLVTVKIADTDYGFGIVLKNNVSKYANNLYIILMIDNPQRVDDFSFYDNELTHV